jgi:hypothetical protein
MWSPVCTHECPGAPWPGQSQVARDSAQFGRVGSKSTHLAAGSNTAAGRDDEAIKRLPRYIPHFPGTQIFLFLLGDTPRSGSRMPYSPGFPLTPHWTGAILHGRPPISSAASPAPLLTSHTQAKRARAATIKSQPSAPCPALAQFN